MKKLNICIAGLGNVGSSLISTLIKNNNLVESKTALSINILGISAKNKNKKRIFNTDNYQWFNNPLDFLNFKNCDVIIELIGEEKGLSFELVKKSLEKRINVITANKALLAKHGSELFKIADENNVLLLFEAAVAGGIPIISNIKNNLFLNDIKSVSGILNGTTNYILTKMYEENLDFDKVLSIAKSKGYTSDSEAELDIGGLDSAHKLTLLTTLCFGTEINYNNNVVEGISKIKITDIIHANKLGYKIKLISEASIIDNKIYSVTGPKLIDKNNPLANVDGVLNAIKLNTDQLKSLFFEGEGAGGIATSSSIISDLYEIFSTSTVASLGFKSKNLKKIDKLNINEVKNPFYLRIMTKDISGVLSKITSYLKDFNISIEKIMQIPNDSEDQCVSILITTYEIKKEKIISAITEIEKQEFILEKIIIIPIDKN